MKRNAKIIIAVVFFCVVTFQLVRAWERRVEGFAIHKIHSTLQHDPKWEIPYSEDIVKSTNAILDQPFYYLGHGFQTYVFESSDKKHVIKFVRHQRLRLSPLAEKIPDIGPLHSFKLKKAEAFRTRTNYLFTGFKVGYEKAQDDTAIVYVHLNKTKDLHGVLTIYDKVGNRFEVILDDVEFVVQKKARLIKPVIDELVAQNDIAGANARVDQIFELLISCAKRGLCDTDGALIRKNNLGFLNNRAIYIDSGKLGFKKHVNMKDRFAYDVKRLYPFEKWLKEKHPELVDHYNQTKERYTNEFATAS